MPSYAPLVSGRSGSEPRTLGWPRCPPFAVEASSITATEPIRTEDRLETRMRSAMISQNSVALHPGIF